MFLRDCWYVAAWSHDVGSQPLGVRVLGEPIVLFRGADGTLAALEDRCAHRWAPLSLGRVEDGQLRCMYHGLKYDTAGRCTHVPGPDAAASDIKVRRYPSQERDGWAWIWMGAAARADESLIPTAFGLDNPRWTMRSGQIDYDADYRLLNDNLCDLSHVDFVHEESLGLATGGGWSHSYPEVKRLERGLRIQRWFVGKPASPRNPALVDTYSTYDYLAPGIFIMENLSFEHGEAQRSKGQAPTGTPIAHRVEQQAVTPMSEKTTRYFYATGFDARSMPQKLIDSIFAVIQQTFDEDHRMIDAQQEIWNLTPPEHDMVFLPQDRAPALFRTVMSRLVKAESSGQPSR